MDKVTIEGRIKILDDDSRRALSIIEKTYGNGWGKVASIEIVDGNRIKAIFTLTDSILREFNFVKQGETFEGDTQFTVSEKVLPLSRITSVTKDSANVYYSSDLNNVRDKTILGIWNEKDITLKYKPKAYNANSSFKDSYLEDVKYFEDELIKRLN